MKRDVELIRKILLRLEESEVELVASEIVLDGYTATEIVRHAQMLVEDTEFLEGEDASSEDDCDFILVRLTYHGHDFVSLARDETAWRRARADVAKNVGGETIELIQRMLVENARSSLQAEYRLSEAFSND